MVPPRPKIYPLFGSLFPFFRDIIGFLRNVANEYSDIAYFLFGGGARRCIREPFMFYLLQL